MEDERAGGVGCHGVLPDLWGAGVAMGRGVREEVSWQFAAAPAAVGPSEHVPSGHLPPGSRKRVGWSRTVPAPAAEGAPWALLAAITPGKEGPDFSWIPKCYCLYRLWKSSLYGLRFLSAETWKALGTKETMGLQVRWQRARGQGSEVSSGPGSLFRNCHSWKGCRDGVCQRGPWNSGGRASLRLQDLPLWLDGPH